MRQGPRTLNIYHQVKFLPKPERNCMGPHMQMATQNRREKKKRKKERKGRKTESKTMDYLPNSQCQFSRRSAQNIIVHLRRLI